MKQKTKKNFGIVSGIVVLVIIGMYLGGFNFPFSVFQFGGSQNSVHLISEDAFSKTYEITATSTRGEFIEKNSASDGTIDAGFGETTSSDGERTLPQILPEQEFISNILTIEGLSAIENFQSGNETTYSDVRISDAKVVCIPYLGSIIILPNTPVKDDIRGQMIGCGATGKLKAYNIYGEEIPVAVFYGGTKAVTRITMLKNGVQCVSQQLVNCGAGSWECLNNQCVQKSVTPPLPPSTLITSPTTTQLIETLTTEDTTKTTETTIISGQEAEVITLTNLTTITTITSLENGTAIVVFENKTSNTTIILYIFGLMSLVG